MYGLACGVLMFGVVSGLCILTSAAIFMAVSAVSKNFEQSNQLVMPILTVLFLFSGFFVPANKIPAMWKWVPDEGGGGPINGLGGRITIAFSVK